MHKYQPILIKITNVLTNISDVNKPIKATETLILCYIILAHFLQLFNKQTVLLKLYFKDKILNMITKLEIPHSVFRIQTLLYHPVSINYTMVKTSECHIPANCFISTVIQGKKKCNAFPYYC